MMNDRELLELAAKAAGINGYWHEGAKLFWTGQAGWEPLRRDDEAFRLAVTLHMDVVIEDDNAWAMSALSLESGCAEDFDTHHGDKFAATRRAIVRASAEIGRTMK